MKALTDCGCGIADTYKNPWCDLVQGSDTNALHLFYKLEWLREEIEKRTSYLGKFRRTDEAKHLLDLISMTTDEEDLFYPFAKAAMSDVFDALEQYAPKQKKAFMWNEGKNSIIIPNLPDNSTITDFTDYSGYSISLPNITSYFKWNGADNRHKVFATIRICYQPSFLPVQEEVQSEAVYDDVNQRWSVTIGIQPLRIDHLELVSAVAVWLEPITYHNGDWVEMNGKPYFCSTDGNANNLDGLIAPTADWRKSVHYMLAFPKDWNSNLAEPLDTAIFEALVSRIIYKWLQYAYPDEAQHYLNEWIELLEKIRERCRNLFDNKIVHRIPRP